MRFSPLCSLVLLFLVSDALSADVTTAAPTTAAPTTAAPTARSSHVTVKCTRDYMEAMIDRKVMSNLDTTNLHLEDANCKSTEITADFIKFRTSLDGCGTTHNVSDDGKYLVYHNAITGDLVAPTTETLITREHTAVMPFQCSYEKVVVLSVHAYTPRRAVIYTRTESFGNFSFTMDMYKTEKYEEAHGDDDYPVNVATGQRLYLEVTVVSNDSSLAVVPVVCKATPTEGYDDKPQYVFINESCTKDKTMKYDFEKSAVQRFSIAAFRFLPSYDNVYFHCKVTACPQGDSNSRCAVGCKSGDKSRRRREVPEREIEYDITLGPVSLKSDKQSMGSAQSAPHSMVTMVTIIAAVLGVIVLALVIGLVVVMKRRRAPQKPHKLLVVD